MEELQMEIHLAEEIEKGASTFAPSFIDPLHLGIENKFRFENLFDLPSPGNCTTVFY